MTLSALDTAAARRAIRNGDLAMLERLLTEGGSNKLPVSLTAATAFINRNDHEGRIITMNRAAGIVATLPAATGSQDRYYFVVQTAFSAASGIIKVANATDVMIGGLILWETTIASAFTGGSMEAAGGTDDTVTMNATTSGGLAGSRVELIDLASGFWLVSGALVCSGSVTTPFSATV